LKCKGKYHCEAHKTKRNEGTSPRRSSIKAYFTKKCTENSNPKNLWEHVQPFFPDKGSKSSKSIMSMEDGKVVNDNKQVSNIFNSFFVHAANSIGY